MLLKLLKDYYRNWVNYTKMNNYNRLLNNLETLKLFKLKENLNVYIDLINNKEKDVVESLYELTNFEIERLNDMAIYGCVRTANFQQRRARH